MARLAIAKEFLAEFHKLEKPVRKRVVDLIDKFGEHTHAGVHLEKPKNAADPRMRTVRVDKYWRGVVLDLGGDDYCLMRVVRHDDAYDRTHRFGVNAKLGVLEVWDQAGLEALEPVIRKQAEATPARLFEGTDDADLLRLGIDEQFLPLVHQVTGEDMLLTLEPALPRPQYDALAGLASGMSVEDVWAEISADVGGAPSEEIDTEDLAAAARRTPDWVAFVEGDDELAQMLQPPFSAWRTYLHATQKAVAFHAPYSGPFLLTGAAGTGKTVTALHRAAHLARTAADPAPGGHPPVLVTTFTRALAATLGTQLDELLENEPAARGRIEVVNVDTLAMRVVSEAWGGQPYILTDRQIRDRLRAAARRSGCSRSVAFLEREWKQVILAQRITTGEQYRAINRKGRGAPIAPSQRAPIWHTVENFVAKLREDHAWTFQELADQAADRLLTDGAPPYRHIVVDEAQDLHPAQWRLLRAAAPPGPDDLFITGDPHQRIYNGAVTLSRLGIETRGRARRLRVSYRTTQEILAAAVPTLGPDVIESLGDDEESLAGYRSLLHGRHPTYRAYGTRQDELEGLVSEVRHWLDAGVEAEAIGVAARENPLAKEARTALGYAGIDTSDLLEAEPGKVRVGTMHSMKGLEFRGVAVIGAESGGVPAKWPVTPADEDAVAHAQDMQMERCLLFVACTRPRDFLTVSYVGTPSPFLPSHTPER